MKGLIFITVMLVFIGCGSKVDEKVIIKSLRQKVWTARQVDGKLQKDSLIHDVYIDNYSNGASKLFIDLQTNDTNRIDSLVLKQDENKKLFFDLDGEIRYALITKGDTMFHFDKHDLNEPEGFEVDKGDILITYTRSGGSIAGSYGRSYRSGKKVKKDRKGLGTYIELEEYVLPPKREGLNEIEESAERLKTTRYFIVENERTYYE